MKQARHLIFHSVNCCVSPRSQVKMLRCGRQTVSVDVDAGVLLFDKKPGSFGVDRVSHDRSKKTDFYFCALKMMHRVK